MNFFSISGKKDSMNRGLNRKNFFVLLNEKRISMDGLKDWAWSKQPTFGLTEGQSSLSMKSSIITCKHSASDRRVSWTWAVCPAPKLQDALIP